MNFLNLAPVSAAPQTTARDASSGAASTPGSAGKLFELPPAASEPTSPDSPVAGATELEVSSLASSAHEDEASPTPSSESTALSAIPEALAKARPNREDALAAVDSRLSFLRAGDKSALRTAPAVGALLPFFSAGLAGQPAPALDPALALAADGTEDLELFDATPENTATADTATDLTPSLGADGLPMAANLPPAPPTILNPRVDAVGPSGQPTAEVLVAAATPVASPPAPDAIADSAQAAVPQDGRPSAPSDASAAVAVELADALRREQPAASHAAPVSPAAVMATSTPSPVAPNTIAPSIESPATVLSAALGRGTATTPAASEDAAATAGESSASNAAAVPRAEALSPEAKNHRGRRASASASSPADLAADTAGPSSTSARPVAGGAKRRLPEDDAPRATPLPTPEMSILAPEAVVPFTQSLARATQELAGPPGAAASTPGAEAAPPPPRDAESPAAAAPRSLDLRSQAWRESLLESARIRLPALGAPGSLQTVTLQLHPRLMGALTVTLALTASGGVQMKLGAQNDRARRFFHGEAPAIAASLARGGLNVSSIEILEPPPATALA